MEVQTRSYNGGLCFFRSLKEAMDFAKKKQEEVPEDDWERAPTEKTESCIWKISFTIESGECVRLVWENDQWVLRQMDYAN